LSPQDAQTVSAHLAACDQCRLELEMLGVDEKEMLPCG
jgi:anti-sigma factor RsiW